MKKTDFAIKTKPQSKFYDHLFIAIFGRNSERSKKWRLELYNALNGTNYTDPDALELNTIENVTYIKMYNDVSFLVDSQMTLYEHQNSTNPNMPLRGLFYFSQLYQKQIELEGKSLLSSRLVKVPNPNFVVFYNGPTERPERYDLKLSDAFIVNDNSGQFEWTAHVININENSNKTLQKKCKPLYDYVRFVSRVKTNRNRGMQIDEAVNEAVDWACKENLLDGFIREQKSEVVAMCLTEYDEEACIRTWREDGIDIGRAQGREEGLAEGARQKAIETARNLLAKQIPLETVLECTGLTEEDLKEAVVPIN